jgi:glucokinase
MEWILLRGEHELKTRGIIQQPIIGIDVGGTKIACGIVEMNGNIISSIQRPTIVTSSEATLDCIADLVKELLTINDLYHEAVVAIGFGIPGFMDAENGIGISSVNLNWINVPVKTELEHRLGVQCVIENDVRAGAMGEIRFGVGKGLQNLVYLNIGTGVSAAIITEGKIFTGVNGLAGEIGHAIQVPNGPICKCGGVGCLEAVVSGPAIATRAQGKINSGRKSILSDAYLDFPQLLTTQKVFEAEAIDDPVARETLIEVGILIANALQYLTLAYDPSMIVIGGSVVQGSDHLFKFIQEHLEELATNSWVFRKVYKKDLIQLSSLGNFAGILGAAALVVPNLDQ